MSLGIEAARQGQCDLAMSALSPVHKVDEEHAYGLYSVLAFCAVQRRDVTEARRAAELARQYAQNSSQKESSGKVLQLLDRAGH